MTKESKRGATVGEGRSFSIGRESVRAGPGFTIVEVLAVIVILGGSLVALSRMVQLGVKSGRFDRERVTAVTLLERKMEQLKAVAYASLTSETAAPVADYPAYDLSVAVTTPETNLKTVLVAVSWNDAFGNQKSATVATHRANY